MTSLAIVIESSGQMKLMTSIALLVIRGAAPLAKALAAIDLLSGGRMLVGAGPDSSPKDYETVGVPFEERWKRFDELVPKLRRSWVQRTEIPDPNFPNGLCIVAYDAGTDGYTQHYFDSRGVVRLYAMTFRDGVWTLLRNSADFSPLDFTQRFTGRFSADGNTIFGTWETGDGSNWTKDFDLTYARVKR